MQTAEQTIRERVMKLSVRDLFAELEKMGCDDECDRVEAVVQTLTEAWTDELDER